MKFSVLVLSIITLISEIILAQDNTTLHLSVNYKNILLAEIIEQIDNKHNIKFSYLDQFVENKRITAFFKTNPSRKRYKIFCRAPTSLFRLSIQPISFYIKKKFKKRFQFAGASSKKKLVRLFPLRM